MKTILLFLAVFFFLQTHATSSHLSAFGDSTVLIKRFKWRITIPDGFAPTSAADSKAAHERGAKLIEKGAGIDVEDNSSVLFKFVDGFNQIEAVRQPLDLTKTTYSAVKQEVMDVMYQAFTTQMSNVRVDTSSAVELIDGLTFVVINIRAHRGDKDIFQAHMYSRMFGKEEFGLNIIYDKPELGEKMLSAFRRSTFHN